MATQADLLASLQKQVWDGSIPLEIRLAATDCRTYNYSNVYLVQAPRLSYLPFLLPRLHTFFGPSLINPDVRPHEGWLSFQNVPLKWHFPLGLLYDIFSGAEPVDASGRRQKSNEQSNQPIRATAEEGSASPIPWRLIVHFTDFPSEQLISLDEDGKRLQGLYMNSVKEADFLRNGSARTVMSLGKEDSDNLWKAVQTHDLALFNRINTKLLNPPGMELRHLPTRIYLPTSMARTTASDSTTGGSLPEHDATDGPNKAGHIRVVQALVPLQQTIYSRQPQTVGTMLNSILPTIFPSRRSAILAQPVLHGAVLPMNAPVTELDRATAYADGFVHIAVAMLS